MCHASTAGLAPSAHRPVVSFVEVETKVLFQPQHPAVFLFAG
jgi:hypothetical protein